MTNRQPAAYVRLTDPAIEDLERLRRHVPQALRWALKEMLLLEENPYAGEPLLGDLVGWRKLVVGDRDWRIVWRPGTDRSAHPVIEIAEVWAVGARSDNDVYVEMAKRVASIPKTPHTVDLAEAIDRFGKLRAGIAPAAPPAGDHVPEWLADQLVHTAGIPRERVERMSVLQAIDAWTEWITKPL